MNLLNDFEENISEFHINFSFEGIRFVLSDAIAEEIGEDGVQVMTQVLENATYDILTSSLIAFDFSVTIEQIEVPISLYIKNENGILVISFNFSFNSVIRDERITYAFSFKLSKVEE